MKKRNRGLYLACAVVLEKASRRVAPSLVAKLVELEQGCGKRNPDSVIQRKGLPKDRPAIKKGEIPKSITEVVGYTPRDPTTPN